MTPASSARRVALFLRERVPAHHAVYGIAWAVAAEAGSSLLAGTHGRRRADSIAPVARWRPGPDTAARASALTLTLVGMRMLDDVKDLEHDRVQAPERPLVSGRVGVGELLAGAAASGAAALSLAGVTLGPASAASLGLTQAYGVALWPLDRALRLHRGGRPSPVGDAALAYPTQALGSVFLILSSIETGAAARSRRALALIPVFASAFLQFEVARKTRSTSPQASSDYSSVLPWQVCAAAIVVLGEAAVWGFLAASRPWRHRGRRGIVAWLPAALSVLPPGAVLGMARGTRHTPSTAPSVGVLLALYLAIPAVTLEVQRP